MGDGGGTQSYPSSTSNNYLHPDILATPILANTNDWATSIVSYASDIEYIKKTFPKCQEIKEKTGIVYHRI